MSNLERYTISIDQCQNVSDDAMASMLSSWVSSTVHSEAWIHDDFVRSLMCNHKIHSCDIEQMSIHILDALEACGLYEYLLHERRPIDIVKCIVKGNMAFLELEWAKAYEEDCSRKAAEEGYRFRNEG